MKASARNNIKLNKYEIVLKSKKKTQNSKSFRFHSNDSNITSRTHRTVFKRRARVFDIHAHTHTPVRAVF